MAIEVEQDIYLAWDAFLEAEAERTKVRPEDRERFIAGRRKSIEAYREFEWPQIRQALARDYHLEMPQGLEPHWTDSGTAVYWQDEVISSPMVTGKSSTGAPIRTLVEVHNGWKPTSPQPANNASQIAHYLRIGFRLRPPEKGLDVMALQSAVPAGAFKQPDAPPPARTYICERHGAGEKRVFPSWKSYVQHCAEKREVLEEKPPAEVLEMASKYKYYCSTHHKGFNYKRTAMHHMKAELAKPGRSVHLSLEQMEMKVKGA